MPFITGKSNSINRRRQTLGREKAIEASLIIATNGQTAEPINVFELIIPFPVGEDVVMGMPASIISGVAWIASNLYSDGKPCHGIFLQDGYISTSDTVRVQIGGSCASNLTLTANKDVYIRDASPHYSQIPLITPDANEDGFQRIGRATVTNSILLNIENFQQIQ